MTLVQHTQSNIHVLSRAIIIDNNHILLAYNPQKVPDHHYYLPGGHIEHHESAKEALIREIQEETGYISTIDNFVCVLENAWQETSAPCHTHDVSFIFTIKILELKFNAHIPQKEDYVAFAWFEIDALEKLNLQPKILKTFIPSWHKDGTNIQNVFNSSIIINN